MTIRNMQTLHSNERSDIFDKPTNNRQLISCLRFGLHCRDRLRKLWHLIQFTSQTYDTIGLEKVQQS